MGERAIDLRHAQSQLADLVQEAARGEDVILTDGGEPVAKIIPIHRVRAPREYGSAKGLIHIADDFDEPLEDSESTCNLCACRGRPPLGTGQPSVSHRDPFDRLICAQAIAETLPIISVDPVLDAYGVQPLW